MSVQWIQRPCAQAPAPAASLMERAAALAGIGAWACDLTDDTLSWTPGTYDLFGLPHDRRLDRRDAVAMYAGESREALERLRAEAIAHRRPFTLDAQIIRADGALRWMRLTADLVCDGRRPVQLYGLKQDITEQKAHSDMMRRLAEQDPLTGLASRRLFQTHFLDRATPQTPLGALILFDVDGFKQINDRHGHAAGDACLQAIADRLCAGFSDALMVARIGGDEFAVLTPPSIEPELLDERVARTLARLAMPIYWRGNLLRVSASAGMAEVNNPLAFDAEALFAAADAALYAAKHAGRNRVRRAVTEVPHAYV